MHIFLISYLKTKAHSGHAKQFISEMSLDELKNKYRGIVVVSGDGLVYEIINGLMSRDDSMQAIDSTAIGQIPGGSGNAFSYSSAYIRNEAYANLNLKELIRQTAFNMTKSIRYPMDLVCYKLEGEEKEIYSFLNFEWAIVSDVDLESEKYRKLLGSQRFTMSALARIMNLRIYRGKLSYLQMDNQDWTHLVEDNYVLVLISCLPFIGSDFMASPSTKTFNGGFMHLTYVKEGISKFQLLKLFLDTKNGNHLACDLVHHCKIKAFQLEPIQIAGNNHGIMMIDGERVAYGKIQAEIKPNLAWALA